MTVAQPISFGEDGLCRVYVLAQGGSVQRLVEQPAPAAPACPAAPPVPPPPPGTPPDLPPGDPPPSAGAVTTDVSAAAQQRLGPALTRGLAARCTVSAPARCTVVATMSAKAARALGLRRDRRATPVTFARGTAVLAAAGDRAIVVRLSAVARRVLGRRTSPFRVAVRLQAEALTAAGERAVEAATIVLVRR